MATRNPDGRPDVAVERQWLAREALRAPASDECIVWRVDLAAALPAGVAELLSDEERGRAGRLRFDRDRRRFVASHVAMRRILGACLELPPQSVELTSGFNGRPQIAGPDGRSAILDFNLSHGGDWALLAVANRAPVGVDVEPLRILPDWAALAERHFSEAELAALRACGADDVQAAFVRCWTRKEAALKSTGIGLAGGADDGVSARHVHVGIGPEELCCMVPGYGPPSALQVTSLEVAAGVPGACARSPGLELRLFDYRTSAAS